MIKRLEHDITMTWNDKIMVKVNDKEYLINVKVKEVKKC